MKIILNRKTLIFELLFLLVVFCENDGMRLFRFSGFTYNLFILIFVGIMVLIAIVRKYYFPKKKTFILYYLIMIVGFILFEYIYTSLLYRDQTLYKFLSFAKSYMLVFMIPIVLFLFEKKGVEQIFEALAFLTTISLALISIHALVFNLTNISILNIDLYFNIATRNSRLRLLDITCLEGLTFIFCWWKILFGEKKILHFIELSICLFAQFYLEQTRMIQITMLSVMFFMYLIKNEKNAWKFVLKLFTVVSGLIIGAYILDYYISSFSSLGEHAGSTTIRLMEIEFAAMTIKKMPLFGIGMIHKELQAKYYYRGIYSRVGLTDIGVLGYTVKAGLLWIIPIYIVPLVRFVKIYKRTEDQKHKMLEAALIVYLLITSLTIVVLDEVRFLMWPICIAYFEYMNNLNKDDNEVYYNNETVKAARET